MPLLSRRRSTLDILAQELRAAKGETGHDPRQDKDEHGLPRANSDHALRTISVPNDRDRSPSLDDIRPPRRLGTRISRHFSDGQLGTRARMMAEREAQSAKPSPMTQSDMPPPTIMTTAPTMDFMQDAHKKKLRGNPFRRQKSKQGSIRSFGSDKALSPEKDTQKSVFSWGRKSMDTKRANRLSVADGLMELASRPSDARPSDASLAPPTLRSSQSGDILTLGSPDKSRKGSMFTLPRKEKRKSLFPLPLKIETPPQYPNTAPATPRESTSGQSRRSASPIRRLSPTKLDPDGSLRASISHSAIPRNNVSFAAPHPLVRNDSNRSVHSTQSSGAPGRSFRFGFRDRASTNSTFGRPSDDATPPTPPTLNGSTRNSTSTSGRGSLGGFLTLGRFRADTTSSQSVNASKAASVPLPERAEGETAAKYLERLQTLASKTVIAGMLSTSGDPFFQHVLRSYTRRFAFFGEPIDMSLRKFLLEAELPKETQQVDRVIQAFADRYHECNPGIFQSPDQAYIIAFSLMMLHTDAFNRNNKHKMQKHDYIKNTRGQQVSEDILACFYDNICYTPFIHFDDDEYDANSDRLLSFKNKKAKLKGAVPDAAKRSSGPVDPYSLIIDNRLDVLRPSIKDSVVVDDPYNYLGTAKSLDHDKIQRAFQLGGILQLISARSRPAAFETHATRENPAEAKPGIIDLRVTKVGILWRKSTKRKKARSPWQEWGAVLTGSQLYFFKNVSWVKTLMQQYTAHQKHMVPPSPCTFTPPLEEFKPDTLMKIDDAVALTDATYNRHKNAFTLISHGGEEEVLLAENESELNDWLCLINYAAAFRSAGVRIRAFIGDKDIETQPPSMRRRQSGISTPTGDLSFRRISNPALTRQVMAARRKRMIAKIAEAEISIAERREHLRGLLRDARHLLILAPIQPKTREVVIHTAARMDALLKWTRRELWRTRCYKDMLYMDALEDSDEIKDEAARMRPLSIYPAETPPQLAVTPEGDGTMDFSRPQTATSAAEDTFTIRKPNEAFSWTLPTVEILRQNDAAESTVDRHPSVSSAVASTASLRPLSITQLSTASSMNDIHRLSSAPYTESLAVSETPAAPVTPSSSVRRDPLAPVSSSGSARPGSDSAAPSPDSLPMRTNRRSLHRSLRDGLHDSGSIRRHRKGKESTGTVKDAAEPEAEGTPGLTRRGERFILHGKQASVITFGEDLRLPGRADGLERVESLVDESGVEQSAAEGSVVDGKVVDTSEAGEATEVGETTEVGDATEIADVTEIRDETAAETDDDDVKSENYFDAKEGVDA